MKILTSKILREAMSVGKNGFSFDQHDLDMTPITEELRMGFYEAGDLLGINPGWRQEYEIVVRDAETTEDIRDFLVNNLDMDEPQADELIRSVINYFGEHNGDVI